MQNKGAIKLLAWLMALVCIYQLMFTAATTRVEKAAKAYAAGDYNKESQYIDSISNEVIYNFLWMRKYTYNECKERQIVFGLDLKGGMNVTLEVQQADIVKALSGNSTDPVFLQALAQATEEAKVSREDFITLFARAFHNADPNARLASVFNTADLSSEVSFNSSDEDVLKVLRSRADAAIENAYIVIRSRIDRFGVSAANIQRLENSGRILVELPGVTERDRVRKLLQGTANLEFWETYENSEIYPYFVQVNARLAEILKAQKSNSASEAEADLEKVAEEAVAEEPKAEDNAVALLDSLGQTQDSLQVAQLREEYAQNNPLFGVLSPSIYGEGQLLPGSVVGMVAWQDTAKVMEYFEMPQIKALLPRDLKLLWAVKAYAGDPTETYFELHAIKQTGRDGRPPLDGTVITSANGDYRQNAGSSAEVSMSMNPEGSKAWARITRDNIGRCIAIVLDNAVYSSPRVNGEITGGNSQITGDFTINEANDLANILKSGKMPAPARIVQDEIVGPSLGAESISAGLLSFILALFLVMVYLAFYYNKGGLVADIALLVNMLFLVGIMASVGVVLTMPGIAGIVLSLGMANDANIIIFERIREELRGGKGLRNAITDGYKNAYSAIIDGQVTTLLTGIILFVFGSGPIQGFATTLVLGILTSLFCAILITRVIYERMLDRNQNIKFSLPMTENVLVNANFPFIRNRKKAYYVVLAVIVAGIISCFTQGFNVGIDFKGGRNYVVRFEESVNTNDIRAALADKFEGSSIEVKTYGNDNQVKITTDYKITENGEEIDSETEQLIYDATKSFVKTADVDFETFRTDYIINSQKVGPSIADDIKVGATIAIIVSLIGIFLYILARFKGWQFGLAALASLAFVALMMIFIYTFFWRIVPFSLEINQHFVAAILTIIGYAINDTVVIFDRIREYRILYPKRDNADTFTAAVNSTLSRTINTSFTTFIVLFIICLLGGEIIRGFTFSMMLGVIIGTLSSIFVASPIAYDLISRSKKK